MSRRWVPTTTSNRLQYIDNKVRTMDWGKVEKKGSQLKVTQHPRLFANEKLTRFQTLRKFLVQTSYRHLDLLDHFIAVAPLPEVRMAMNDDSFVPYLTSALKESALPEIAGLSTAFGKMVYADNAARDKAVNARLESWLFNNRKHTIAGSEDRYYTEFDAALSEFFSMTDPTSLPPFISFESFVKNPALWATAGAIEYKKMVQQVAKAYDTEIISSKWSFALLEDPNKLYSTVLEIMLGKEPLDQFVIEKSEPDTVRLIVLGDLTSYLVDSYIMYFTEACLTRENAMLNSMSFEEQQEFFQNKMMRCGQNAINLDLDYSTWDEGVLHRDQIHIRRKNLHWLSTVRPEINSDNDINLIRRHFVHGVRRERIVWNTYNDNKKKQMQRMSTSGMISGKRITYTYNSIQNYCANKIAKKVNSDPATYALARAKDAKLAPTPQAPDYITDIFVVGDDVDAEVKSYAAGEAHIRALTHIGFTVNMIKSKISRGHGEFKKVYYSDRYITGDPLRSIRSLLWSTESEEGKIGDEKRISRVDTWARFMSRGLHMQTDDGRLFAFELNDTRLADLIVTDLRGAFNSRLSKRDLYDYIRTPSTIGGGGLLPCNFNSQFVVASWDVRDDIPTKKIRTMLLRRHSPAAHLANEPELVRSVAKLMTGGNYVTKEMKLHKTSVEQDFYGPLAPITVIPPPGSVRYPVNRDPKPGGQADTLRAVLVERRVKDVFIDLDNHDIVQDGEGNWFTRNTLVEFSFANWLYSRRKRFSMVTLQMLLDGMIQKPPVSRLATVVLGEVSAYTWWDVVAPVLSFNIVNITGSLAQWLSLMVTLEKMFIYKFNYWFSSFAANPVAHDPGHIFTRVAGRQWTKVSNLDA